MGTCIFAGALWKQGCKKDFLLPPDSVKSINISMLKGEILLLLSLLIIPPAANDNFLEKASYCAAVVR